VRRFRKIIDVSTPVIGTVIVFLAIILIPDFNIQARIFTVLAGVLLIQAGVWKLTSPFLPSDRKYTELRDEVDGFIGLVRALNSAALDARAAGTDEAWLGFRGALGSMHDSVERMGTLAGKDPAGEPTELPASS
jgi:putative Mn2+ efflux pump MntP